MDTDMFGQILKGEKERPVLNNIFERNSPC